MTRRTWILGVCGLMVGIALGVKFLATPTGPLPRVTLLTTRTPFSAAIALAHKRGWFQEAGVDVTVIERPSGKDALAELVDGNGEYATASETPIMFSLLKSQPMRIISSLSIGTDTISMIGRRDLGIESSDHLQGKRIGMSPGTTSQYFLDTFLEYRGIKPDAVMRIPLKPDEMSKALRDGTVDAVSAWAPYNTLMLEELGANGRELRVGTAYRWNWYLVARNEAVASKVTTQKLLTALIRSTDALEREPVICARELAPSMGLTTEQLLKVWEHTQFEVTLDQSLLLTLELQARWAISSGLTDQKEVPNFLPATSSQALRAIDRGLVTLIDGEARP